MSGSYALIKVSIDCVPQTLAGLRYAEPGAPDQRARLIVPLTFMRKGTLKGFDMTDGAGRAAPTVGRSEYGGLLVETLLFEIRGSDAAAGQGGTLRDALSRVVDDDPEAARGVADDLVDRGTYEDMPCLDPQKLTDYAASLIHKLAEWCVLIALLPWEEGGRRVIVKYRHHSRQDLDVPPWRTRLQISAGWDSLDVGFDLSYPEGSASHHFEIVIPPDLACERLTMPSTVHPDRNTADISPSGVAHVAGRFVEDEGQVPPLRTERERIVEAKFRVPWHGLRSNTFWIYIITFMILTLGVALPGAQRALLHNAGSAAILLAVPAAVVAVAAGRVESALSALLLRPLRGTIIGCALLLLACAGSIVGQLREPWRETLWICGAAATLLAAMALCGRDVSQSVGDRWHNFRTSEKEAGDEQERSN